MHKNKKSGEIIKITSQTSLFNPKKLFLKTINIIPMLSKTNYYNLKIISLNNISKMYIINSNSKTTKINKIKYLEIQPLNSRANSLSLHQRILNSKYQKE